MNNSAPVLRQDKQGVSILTLNRPNAYNALSLSLMNALIKELEHIGSNSQTRVVIINGAGRGFCAGHDLREMTLAQDPEVHLETFQTCSKLMLTLSRLPQPVIAQVHGIATAAGCQLVASCDLAIASDDTRFATPGVNIGLFCSTPMVALSRSLSRKHTMEMLLLGEMISAQRAYEMGLINRVVESGNLESETLTLANQLASKSAMTLRTGKQAFYNQVDLSLSEAYEHCSNVMSCNFDTEDAREGIDAFLSKRPPTWKDC